MSETWCTPNTTSVEPDTVQPTTRNRGRGRGGGMGRAPARARGKRSGGRGGAQDFLRRAEAALAVDDYAAAVEALSRGMETHPKSTEVRAS